MDSTQPKLIYYINNDDNKTKLSDLKIEVGIKKIHDNKELQLIYKI